jgi:hypothetical protein
MVRAEGESTGRYSKSNPQNWSTEFPNRVILGGKTRLTIFAQETTNAKHSPQIFPTDPPEFWNS